MNTNVLKRLITTYPHKKWDHDSLLKNPCIDYKYAMDIDLFKKSSSAKLTYLVYNSDNLTLDDAKSLFKDYIHNSNALKYLIEYGKYTLNKLMIITEFNYSHLLRHIGESKLINYPNTEIPSGELSLYDVNLIYQHMPWYRLQIYYKPGKYPEIFSNKSITLDIIRETTDLRDNINYKYLSSNPNITIEYVLEHKDKEWNWVSIIINNGITMEEIYENYDLFSWGLKYCAFRLDITKSFIEYIISKIDISLQKNLANEIMHNPALSFDEIKSLFSLKENILLNPTLSYENAIECIGKIKDEKYCYQLSNNKFEMSEKYKKVMQFKKNRQLRNDFILGLLLDIIPKDINQIILTYLYFI
jgi:hypothetical protein